MSSWKRFQEYLLSSSLRALDKPEPIDDVQTDDFFEDTIARAFGRALSQFATEDGELKVADGGGGIRPVV